MHAAGSDYSHRGEPASFVNLVRVRLTELQEAWCRADRLEPLLGFQI